MMTLNLPLWLQNCVRFFTFFLKLNKDKTQNTFNFNIMSQIYFPIEIWHGIMNYQPLTYVVISRLSKWHYVGVVDKLQHYKTASCVEVIGNNAKYYKLPNGELHGKSIGYYEPGKLMCECEFVDGKRHGKCTSYYKSGKVMCECEYRDGELHGKFIGYYESGEVRYEYEFEDGELIDLQLG